MNKSHIHQFHHNINKSSPLPYVGLNLYLFISKKFILFTWAIVFLEREVNSLGYSFSVAMDDFSHFNSPRWTTSFCAFQYMLPPKNNLNNCNEFRFIVHFSPGKLARLFLMNEFKPFPHFNFFSPEFHPQTVRTHHIHTLKKTIDQ